MEAKAFFVTGLLYLQGNVKDYQLWVSSKRDNAPYPLIGKNSTLRAHPTAPRHRQMYCMNTQTNGRPNITQTSPGPRLPVTPQPHHLPTAQMYL